jgi:hypothetical protein
MTAATDCHETVMVATLNIRARFERYPNSPGFSDEPGLFFCVKLKDFVVLVVAPQGKTTVSFRSPVPPHSAGSKWKTVDSTFDTGALTKPGALVTYFTSAHGPKRICKPTGGGSRRCSMQVPL